jgi:hypothetical protein
LPGGTDKWTTRAILICTGSLAKENDSRANATFTKNRLGAFARKIRTALTGCNLSGKFDEALVSLGVW